TRSIRSAAAPDAAAAEAVGRGPGRAPDPVSGRVRGLARPAARVLADSRTAELLGVCDVDLDALDIELPRGFGRD
ncbi:MAG: hypothetical protein OXG35_32215, partial [Acidobacteria bacterium]|nr:hypothetical protein [Acidobacteriota bacterium]